MSLVDLTANSIQKIQNGSTDFVPTLQVLDIKKIGTGNARYRLIVSDGVYMQQAMLATQMNPLVQNNELASNCIIEMKTFLCNEVQDKKILIVLDLQVLSNPGKKIGNPKRIGVPGGAAPLNNVTNQNQVKSESSYKSKPATPQQTNRPPVLARSNSTGNVVPVSSLNPYISKWTIRARVTVKGDIRRWSNDRGEGCLFSVDLLDKDGGEIKATFFKDAVDQFYDKMHEGSVYLLGNGRLKLANRKFTSINNDYEINFGTDANIIHDTVDGDATIEMVKYNFKTIDELSSMDVNQTSDLIAILKVAFDTQGIKGRDGRDLLKRDFILLDRGLQEMRFTIWGDKCNSFTPEQLANNPVLAIKSVKTGEFNGQRTLGSVGGTSMDFSPDIPEAHELKGWYDTEGHTQVTTGGSSGGGGGRRDAFDNRNNLNAIITKGLGYNEKPDYINTSAMITFLKHDNEPWYPACPSVPKDGQRKCQKKVVFSDMENMYRCEKCDQAFPTCDNRFILSICVTDHTGNHWSTLFNDQAVELLGKSANDLAIMKETDERAYSQVFEDVNFTQRVFNLRVKNDTSRDEARLRINAVGLKSLDYISEVNDMFDYINKMDV